VFFGFYPVVEVEIGSKSVPIFDAVGKDTVLFHHSVSDDDHATGSQYVDQARRWLRSTWPTILQCTRPASGDGLARPERIPGDDRAAAEPADTRPTRTDRAHALAGAERSCI
jgi:hypothetical protein